MNTKPHRIAATLKQQIISGKLPGGSRLPSMSDLCLAFSVSRSTLFSAFSELEQQGLISRRERVGVFVCGVQEEHAASLPVPLPRLSKEKQLAADLKAEICRGVFRAGSFLPPPKVLRHQYQSSHRTVRDAIRLLLNEGLIHRKGRVHVIGPGDVGTTRPIHRVLFVSDSLSLDTFWLAGVHANARFVQSLANTLHELGLWMEQGTRLDGADLVFPKESVLKKACGVIMVLTNPAFLSLDGDQFSLFEEFLKRMDRLILPCVMFQTIPYSAAFLRNTRKYRGFYPISLGYFRPGRSVGRHLAILGHRELSFFSFTNEDWDSQRSADVQKSHLVMLGSQSIIHQFPAKHDNWAFLRKYSTKEDGQHFSKFIEKEHNGYVFQNISGFNPYWRAKSYITNLIWQDRLSSVMQPYFKEALKNKACSAWVCADPAVALAAAAFLNGEGVRIPRDLSLISIDDQMELAIRGITAFSFQGERIGYLGAHCLAGDIPIKRKRNGLVDCPGRIIERGSLERRARS